MKRISLLCVCSITVSVTALILVDSVMNLAHQVIQDRLLSVTPHLSVKVSGAKSFKDLVAHPSYLFLRYHEKPLRVYPYASLDAVLYKEWGAFQGVKLTSMREKDLQAFLKNLYLKGKGKDKDEDFHPLAESLQGFKDSPRGQGFQDLQDFQIKKNEAAVGVDMANYLSLFEGSSVHLILPESLLLPPDVPLRQGKLTVKHLLHTNTEADSKDIFYSYGSLSGFESALGLDIRLAVWMKNPHKVSWWREQLASFADVQTEDWRQKNSTLFHALSLERWLIGLFLSLSTLIAGFSIVSVLTLLVSRKRHDIGLLLSMGLSLKRTKRLFHRIGFILSLVGIGAGTLLGLALSFYLQIFPLNILPSGVYREAEIGASVRFFSVFLIIGISVLLSFLISYLPVYSLSRLSITKLVGRHRF